MTLDQGRKSRRRTASRPSARAAALAAVAAASLVAGAAKADAGANMNLGYEFLDEASRNARLRELAEAELAAAEAQEAARAAAAAKADAEAAAATPFDAFDAAGVAAAAAAAAAAAGAAPAAVSASAVSASAVSAAPQPVASASVTSARSALPPAPLVPPAPPALSLSATPVLPPALVVPEAAAAHVAEDDATLALNPNGAADVYLTADREEIRPNTEAPRVTGYTGVVGTTETGDAAAVIARAVSGSFEGVPLNASGGAATARLGNHRHAHSGAGETRLADPRLAEAEHFYREGRYEEALPLFKAVAGANPSNAHAWLRIGNLMHRKRDWFDALSAYRRAARPDADPTIREKAVYNVALLNLELARQAMKRLERLRLEGHQASLDGREMGTSGVGDRSVRQLSDQLGTAYAALADARATPVRATETSVLRTPAPAPAPGPRAAKPPSVEKPVQVEIRQGGMSR